MNISYFWLLCISILTLIKDLTKGFKDNKTDIIFDICFIIASAVPFFVNLIIFLREDKTHLKILKYQFVKFILLDYGERWCQRQCESGQGIFCNQGSRIPQNIQCNSVSAIVSGDFKHNKSHPIYPLMAYTKWISLSVKEEDDDGYSIFNVLKNDFPELNELSNCFFEFGEVRDSKITIIYKKCDSEEREKLEIDVGKIGIDSLNKILNLGDVCLQRKKIIFEIGELEVTYHGNKLQVKSKLNLIDQGCFHDISDMDRNLKFKLMNCLEYWSIHPNIGLLDESSLVKVLDSPEKMVLHCLNIGDIINLLKKGYMQTHVTFGLHKVIRTENNGNLDWIGDIESYLSENDFFDKCRENLSEKLGKALASFIVNYTFEFFNGPNISALEYLLNRSSCWMYRLIGPNWKAKRYLCDINYIFEISGVPRMTHIDRKIVPTKRVRQLTNLIPKAEHSISRKLVSYEKGNENLKDITKLKFKQKEFINLHKTIMDKNKLINDKKMGKNKGESKMGSVHFDQNSLYSVIENLNVKPLKLLKYNFEEVNETSDYLKYRPATTKPGVMILDNVKSYKDAVLNDVKNKMDIVVRKMNILNIKKTVNETRNFIKTLPGSRIHMDKEERSLIERSFVKNELRSYSEEIYKKSFPQGKKKEEKEERKGEEEKGKEEEKGGDKKEVKGKGKREEKIEMIRKKKNRNQRNLLKSINKKWFSVFNLNSEEKAEFEEIENKVNKDYNEFKYSRPILSKPLDKKDENILPEIELRNFYDVLENEVKIEDCDEKLVEKSFDEHEMRALSNLISRNPNFKKMGVKKKENIVKSFVLTGFKSKKKNVDEFREILNSVGKNIKPKFTMNLRMFKIAANDRLNEINEHNRIVKEKKEKEKEEERKERGRRKSFISEKPKEHKVEIKKNKKESLKVEESPPKPTQEELDLEWDRQFYMLMEEKEGKKRQEEENRRNKKEEKLKLKREKELKNQESMRLAMERRKLKRKEEEETIEHEGEKGGEKTKENEIDGEIMEDLFGFFSIDQ